jgi:hypothetical protein
VERPGLPGRFFREDASWGARHAGCQTRGAGYLFAMRSAPVALLALLLADPAAAQTMTAGALQGMCAGRNQTAACASYIQGYVDGRNQSLGRRTVCLPAGTSMADVAGAFSQHVARNRLEANLEAGLVLGNFLISTYSCR